MLTIRLRRGGAKRNPIYRVVVSDSRQRPTSKYLDQVGFYNPNTEPPEIRIDLAKVEEWQGMKQMHGPTAVGQCTACHDPHSSDWDSLTKSHPTDLCNLCHVAKKLESHVLANGHPVRGKSNPLNPDTVFSCASCHNPHGSDYDALMNLNTQNGVMAICLNCHKK